MSKVDVWAPFAHRVHVRVTATGEGDHGRAWLRELQGAADGWFSADVNEAMPGRQYVFLLDDDDAPLPDPRSRRQPDGVHGPSQFYEDTFDWTDADWSGHPLPGAIIYEMHIGTFTDAGTFDAAIERLEYLADLGVTHVEVLPVNDFNGPYNWGYDGVLWYAVHENYGGPDGLKRFVDACHARGLAVTLDVVYNHLGASGNYLPHFGPYFKSGSSTWGDLINLDGENSRPVRDYVIDNALMWLDEFHIDSLRLDAVHALKDESHPHLLAELSERVDALSHRVGRPLTLIAESDLNDPIMVTPREDGGYGMDAQWDDDVHHSLHALISGEKHGYYADFGSLGALSKVLTGAFFHDGTYSTFRGRNHGKPVDRDRTPAYRFVACLQNHDQVGNRAAGDRLPEITPADLLKVGAVLLLTSPFTPMLWMGEEWAASTRWPFFTSHPEPELAAAVGKGRLEEFAEHGWDPSEMVDPQDPAAFDDAKLRWDERAAPAHGDMLAVYRELLRLRREWPDLSDPDLAKVTVDFDEDDRWLVVHRGELRVVANVGTDPCLVPTEVVDVVFATDSAIEVQDGLLLMPARSAAIARRARRS
jgi:maltooligosyltrehalose trehalohydrolase